MKRPPVWPSSLAKIATKSVGKVLWPFVGEFFALFESLDLGEVEPKRSCFEVWTCSRNDLQVEMMSKFTKRFAEIYAKMICLNVKIEPRRILFLQTSLRIISLGRRFSILMYIVVISFPKKSVLRAKRKADFELLLCFFYFYFENLTWIQKKMFWNHGLVPFVTEVPGSSKRTSQKKRGRKKTRRIQRVLRGVNMQQKSMNHTDSILSCFPRKIQIQSFGCNI